MELSVFGGPLLAAFLERHCICPKVGLQRGLENASVLLNILSKGFWRQHFGLGLANDDDDCHLPLITTSVHIFFSGKRKVIC